MVLQTSAPPLRNNPDKCFLFHSLSISPSLAPIAGHINFKNQQTNFVDRRLLWVVVLLNPGMGQNSMYRLHF